MSNQSRISTKAKALILCVVAAVILYIDFGRPRPTGPPETNESPAAAPQTKESPAALAHDYKWLDRSSGAVYLVHETGARNDNRGLTLEDPSIVPVPTSIVLPYPVDQGIQAKTYRLYHKSTVGFKLPRETEISDFLIGETHLGPSQVQVARTMTDLFAHYEVDAVFVEQPDDLNYDWSKFKSLEGNRAGAIAALQQQMREDSRADLSPFLPYLKKAKSDEDALNTIQRHFGASGVKRLELALSTSERYEKSEYVSAMDYYYVALRLQGLMIPFYNVESRALRDQFEAKSATASSIEDLRGEIRDRDKYMAAKGSEIIRQNGYHRVIWIVGAEHLKSLPDFLLNQHQSIKVAYNSLNNVKVHAYKKELMLLINPAAFLSIAGRQTEAPLEQDLVPSRTPSQELQESIRTVLLQPGLGTSDIRHRTAILKAFETAYSTRTVDPNGSWSLALNVGPNDTVEIKRIAQHEYEIERNWPVTINGEDRPSKLAPSILEVDPALRDRLRNLNANQQHVRIFTVKDTGTNYAIYADKDSRPLLGTNNIGELLSQVTSQLGSDTIKSVYLELEGFTKDKAAAFESSCRIQSRQSAIPRSITSLPVSLRDVQLRDAYFSKARLNTNLPAEITVIDRGPFQGFVRASVHFLVMVGGNLQRFTLEVYVKTKDIASQAVTRLRALSLNESLTLADMVAVVRSEIKKENNQSDEDVAIRFRQQIGGTLIVYASPPRAGDALA